MTVETTTARKIVDGNNSATSFTTGFKVLNDDDLTVILRDNSAETETTLVQDTHYSLSGIGDSEVTVTYPLSGSPLTATESLVLIREVDYDQSTSIANQTGFYPEVLEAALDFIVMQVQQLREELQRSLRLSKSSASVTALVAYTALDRDW